MKRQQDIQRILEDSKGVRNILGIKSAKKKVLITKIKNDKGESITSRKGIADVFGEFYKRLYEDHEKDDSEHEVNDDGNYSNTDAHNNDTEETAGIPDISTEEWQTAINKLKKGKSRDNKGIRADDIKDCDEEKREMVRHIFNEIIKRKEFTPEDWKKVTIKVIHKKGDVENVSKQTVLDNSVEDQAGFRKSYQKTDHLATYRLTEQKCHEWGIKMWTATVDFTKAFDSITHKSIWKALKPCGFKHDYVSLSRRPRYRQTKRATFSRSEKEPSKVIRCPACCSTQCFSTP